MTKPPVFVVAQLSVEETYQPAIVPAALMPSGKGPSAAQDGPDCAGTSTGAANPSGCSTKPLAGMPLLPEKPATEPLSLMAVASVNLLNEMPSLYTASRDRVKTEIGSRYGAFPTTSSKSLMLTGCAIGRKYSSGGRAWMLIAWPSAFRRKPSTG